MRVKYPRTFHLPWSPGGTGDDKTLSSVSHFVGKEVVVTEKMDGENTTIYSDGYVHARSMDGAFHPSQSWVKKFASEHAYLLPPGWRICGENLYAMHSCYYETLPSYFLLFAIYDEDNTCLSWKATEGLAADTYNIQTVPVLYRGVWDEDVIKSLYTSERQEGAHGPCEGYVVRTAGRFPYSEFSNNVAKFVRSGHVAKGATHWRHSEIRPNKLRE